MIYLNTYYFMKISENNNLYLYRNDVDEKSQ